MNADFVVTISSTKQSKPVHIVLPVDEFGGFIYEEIYILMPVDAVLPERYTTVLEEALQALEVAVRFMIEGKRPDKYKGLGDWIPRPLDE